MELKIQGGGEVTVSDSVFGRDYVEGLVHQVVVAFMAGGRAGTKAQKNRANVHGTTKKFKKQKGGGARHGDYKAPIFVGGGRAFAAQPRDHSQKLNRKMYRAAMQVILSQLVRSDRLEVVNDFDVQAPRTSEFKAQLKTLGMDSGMLVTAEVSEQLHLASRNVPHVDVTDVHGLNPVSLVGSRKVVVTTAALKQIEEWLA
jgi:large subunit ribosomal protein L4